MKTLLLSVVSVSAFLSSTFASPLVTKNSTIKDVSEVIPLRVLQRCVSPKFYKSLRISPIKGWTVVSAQLSGTHLSGARIVRSSLNGAYDSYALKLAAESRMAGAYSAATAFPTHNVLMHVLVYQIADGTMAVSFAHLDQPGGNQMQYFGCARLMVLKGDGRWTEIRGPESLQGKGWAVRDNGFKNDLDSSMRLEKFFHDIPPRAAYYHDDDHGY